MREVQGEAVILIGLVIAFFAVVATGPAGTEYLDRRRVRRQDHDDQPLARVVGTIPSAACRGAAEDPVLTRVRARRTHEKSGCVVVGACPFCDRD